MNSFIVRAHVTQLDASCVSENRTKQLHPIFSYTRIPIYSFTHVLWLCFIFCLYMSTFGRAFSFRTFFLYTLESRPTKTTFLIVYLLLYRSLCLMHPHFNIKPFISHFVVPPEYDYNGRPYEICTINCLERYCYYELIFTKGVTQIIMY